MSGIAEIKTLKWWIPPKVVEALTVRSDRGKRLNLSGCELSEIQE